MRSLRGVAASPGVGLGPAWVHRESGLDLPTGPVDDRDAEAAALSEALEWVADDLTRRGQEAGGEAGEILEAQAAMAADPELADAAVAAITTDGVAAARAVIDAGETYAQALAASDNEYLAARASDIRDVCRRVARRLLGVPEPDLAALTEPAVIVAGDLSPAVTARLDPAMARALVTEAGSRTSHTAILARALGVPAVVAVDGLLAAATHGQAVGVDGDAGEVHLDPDDEVASALRTRAEAAAAREARLREQAGTGPLHTVDGRRVELAANVGGTAELRAALDGGAEAVGLLRTEFAYLGQTTPPEESEQAGVFAEMARMLDGGRLVVRTFDFGADKPVPFLDMPAAVNPALGVRGIRLARRHPELLDTQLRAIVAAAGHGRVAVMAPMVAGAEEARWFRERVEAAGGRDAGVEVGAMVEVPSAVLLADEIAAELDFLSIGTNDLTQYLHAADRQEGALAALQDPFAPAVVRATARVCEAAARHDTWVGVCGEAAGDPAWALLAVGLGVVELSMGAASLLQVRATVAAASASDCASMAREAVAAADATETRRLAESLANRAT